MRGALLVQSASMTAFMELGATSAFVCTAATTLGIGGYANSRVCIERMCEKKSRHHTRGHHLDPPHHDELVSHPFRKEDMPVKISGTPVGSRDVEFNGEILSIAPSAAGSPEPALALGGCNIRVNDCRVVATPHAVPSIELTFPNSQEAQQWAKEFKEASLVGPPQKRINELIDHSLKVEKHVVDLRKRAARAHEIDQANTALKKQLKLAKCGFGSAEEGTGSQFTKTLTWISGSSERKKLQEELEHQREELEHAHQSEQKLKSRVADHARQDSVAGAKWRAMAMELLKLHPDEVFDDAAVEVVDAIDSGILEPKVQEATEVGSLEPKANQAKPRDREETRIAEVGPLMEAPKLLEDSERPQDVTKLDDPPSSLALEPKFDPKRERKLSSPDKSPVAPSRVVARQSAQENENKHERLAQAIEQRFKEIESRLAYSRQTVEAQLRAEQNGATLALQDENRAVAAPQVNAFKSLEDRIRSHQMIVNQDCDVLQYAMKAISRV